MYSGSELKRSSLHFLAGKFVSAILTLTILLWLVRLLTTEEYGVYVLLVAGMELSLAIMSFGLPWLLARYLPEFRINASHFFLKQFIWKIITWFICLLTAGVFLLFLAIQWFFPADLAHYSDVTKLYLLVFFLEGLSQRIRENVLGPLMQQRKAQISLAVRNLIFLLLIGITVFSEDIHLYHVVFAEIAASAVGLILALHGLNRYLNTYQNTLVCNNWEPPDWSEMWQVARNMYFSNLMIMTYSPQVFILLTQRFLGIEATALFGFLCKLYSQIVNYLPATLLFSLIQPKLVASYVNAGNMDELTRNANLAGKLSLFVLMPVVIYVWLVGDELLSLLSNNKFMLSGSYLSGLILALIPLSQHQILETIVVVINKNHIVLWGSTLGMISLPIAYVLMVEAGLGLWGPITAMIVSQLLFSATILVFLTRNTTHKPDTTGFLKLAATALCVFLTLGFLTSLQIQGWVSLFIMALLVFGFYLLVAYFIKPFKVEERERLNKFMNRKFFIW